MPKRSLVVAMLTSVALPLVAEPSHRPFAGYEARTVASLSASDIDDLEAGRGWGLALPAELNSYPGPLHALELAEPLQLTEA